MNNFETIISRWTDPDRRPLFRGSLIDDDGCCCAQGDILRHECGMDDEALRDMEQSVADNKVAETLGISRFHAVLLRIVNDRQDGCPQEVLADPEKVLGGKWRELLAFGRWIDAMTNKQWTAAGTASWTAARTDAETAARAAARTSAGIDAWTDAGIAAWKAARTGAETVARSAAWEIMGSDILEEQGRSFYFLPMLGISSIEQLMAWDVENNS